MYTAPNWTAPMSASVARWAAPRRAARRNGMKTTRDTASLAAPMAVGSMPASPFTSPNEKAQMKETMRRRIIGKARPRARSHAENRAEPPAEEQAHARDHGPKEDHCPDAERAREELAVAEELEEPEDRLRDREIGHLLRQDDGIADLEHGERECEEGARHEVGRDQRQRDPDHRPERRAAEVFRGLLERHARLLE